MKRFTEGVHFLLLIVVSLVHDPSELFGDVAERVQVLSREMRCSGCVAYPQCKILKLVSKKKDGI